MSIRDQIIADNEIFLAEDAFAEAVTYNGSKIMAIVALGDSAIKGNTFESKGQAAVGTVQVSALDVPVPNTGDEVVHKSVSWTVTRILESDFAMHMLQLVTSESAF